MSTARFVFSLAMLMAAAAVTGVTHGFSAAGGWIVAMLWCFAAYCEAQA